MPTTVTESCRASEALTATDSKGRIQITLITPGIGSSGYYSPQVLENAGRDKVWPKGTHVFFDHPSESEMYDRPERSVRDLAAVLDEDAHWDGEGLVAEASVIGPYRELVTDPVFVEAVGMSIRATAESRAGEVDGKKCTIITAITEGISVDLVTRAGRGGRVSAVLESARVMARKQLTEATANDTRDALMDALKGAYGGDKTWVWVRDFDGETVWFEYETPDEQTVYQQAYTLDDQGTAVLAEGDPLEVRARTEYVPVTPAAESGTPDVPAPAGQSTTTQESEEDTMPQIEEARLRQLEEDAGRVTTLESERDTAQRERDEAREALAAERRTAAANRVIGEAAEAADVTFDRFQRSGLLATLPVAEDGTLDEAAFRTTCDEAAAEIAESQGAGGVRGFGATTGKDTDVIAEAEKAAAGAFGRETQEA